MSVSEAPLASLKPQNSWSAPQTNRSAKMNTPWPSVQLDPELETARATLSPINALVDEAVNHTEVWLRAKDKMHNHEWAVIRLHARRLRTHSAALAQRIAELGSPFFSRLIAAAD